MKDYKLEVWATLICFIIVAVIGGFFSSLVVILNEVFFTQVPTPEGLVAFYGETMFLIKENLQVTLKVSVLSFSSYWVFRR